MSKIDQTLAHDYRNKMNRTAETRSGKLPLPRECVARSLPVRGRIAAYVDNSFSTVAHTTVRVLLKVKRGVYRELPDAICVKRVSV